MCGRISELAKARTTNGAEHVAAAVRRRTLEETVALLFHLLTTWNVACLSAAT